MFKISTGNSKLGKIYNINLPAVITCRKNAPCAKECYANKGTYNFPAVKKCYSDNLQQWKFNPMQAFLDILSQLPEKGNHYCRIHSSGDFPDLGYFRMLMEIARRRSNIQFMGFTKKYELVNEYLKWENIPKNVTIVYSGWEGLKMDNPYNMPTSWVYEHNLHNATAFPCSGHCDNCYHCWDMLHNMQVVFHKH